MKGTGAEVLVRYLENEGVKYVFGLPGGHLLTFYDAVRRSTITPILAKHEGGAAYMAAGHALAGAGYGVCCGTVGPGTTNLVSGVAAAYMGSLPMLVLTAQVGTPTIGKGGLQEAAGEGRSFSQTQLLSAVTKHSTMVTHASKLPDALRRALRIATSGRPGPVHLDLPADTQGVRSKTRSLSPASIALPSPCGPPTPTSGARPNCSLRQRSRGCWWGRGEGRVVRPATS